MRQTNLNRRSREAVNSGSILLREARTKAQESYLAGVVYSKCRVDLSRYLGPGRYRGIRAILSRFHVTYGQKCAYMSTSVRVNTNANSMWMDTHGLLAVNPRAWHMWSLAVDVCDVAQER